MKKLIYALSIVLLMSCYAVDYSSTKEIIYKGKLISWETDGESFNAEFEGGVVVSDRAINDGSIYDGDIIKYGNCYYIMCLIGRATMYYSVSYFLKECEDDN